MPSLDHPMAPTVTAAAEKLRRDTARRTVDGPDEPFNPWKLALAIPALLVFCVVMVPVSLVLTFASCFVVLVHWLVGWARRV